MQTTHPRPPIKALRRELQQRLVELDECRKRGVPSLNEEGKPTMARQQDA